VQFPIHVLISLVTFLQPWFFKRRTRETQEPARDREHDTGPGAQQPIERIISLQQKAGPYQSVIEDDTEMVETPRDAASLPRRNRTRPQPADGPPSRAVNETARKQWGNGWKTRSPWDCPSSREADNSVGGCRC